MPAHDLVKDNVQLLSLPEVCLRIQQLAEDPTADMAEFGQAVSQDPALTTRLLRLVNSAYYGFPGRIDTLSRAVNVVGIAELRNLTLAMAAMEVFGGLENERFDLLGFWRHSVHCALIARFLAKRARVLHAERLFIAGLLHDVGRLLIFSLLPEVAARIEWRIAEGEPVIHAERLELAYDHAELGAELLALWGLPPELRSAVGAHHQPLRAETARLEASLVHIANQIARQVECVGEAQGANRGDPFRSFTDPGVLAAAPAHPLIDAIPDEVWATAGLDASVVDDAVAAAAVDFDEVLNILYSV